MRRRLFNFAAILSLLLFVATAALWVRSYAWMDSVMLYPTRMGCGIQSWRGVISVQIIYPFSPAWKLDLLRHTPADRLPATPSAAPSWWHFGVRPVSFHERAQHYRGLEVRHGLLLLLSMPLPLIALIQRRARTEGVCRTCGYDLRATPHRCPECGAEANASASA